MRVWILNLIDNRGKNNNTPEKFRQCKDTEILAIGWAQENPLIYYKDDDLKAYMRAIKGLSNMEVGDLVWVRDTVNREYYVCKVCGALQKAPPNLWHKDIGEYRKAEWYGPVLKNELPAPLTARRLVSRSTIRRVLKPDVIQATQEFFNSTIVHKKSKFRRFKMRKFTWMICCVILAACLLFAFPAEAQKTEVIDSGTCGENLTWTLDAEDTLTISGTGAMKDYYGDSSPWYNSPDIRSVVLSNGVTSIGAYAFEGCTNLTSITIPKNVTTIGIAAFYNCSSLTSITIPDSVTTIGESVFDNCSSLTGIWVEEGNAVYASDAKGVLFNKEMTRLLQAPKSISGAYTIPDTVTDIDYWTFSGCASLTSITIPDTVTAIDDGTFSDCISLTSITIPDRVTYIGISAFSGCTSLTSITIPDSLTFIEDGAFYGCSSLEYNNYNNAKYLGNSGNPYHVLIDVTSTSITSCVIHENTKYIYQDAFAGCEYLTSIIIPDSVTKIDAYAFSGCTSLISIKIPASVTHIGYYAFSYCDSLTSITIPNSVTTIGEEAFYNCSSLTGIWVEEGNTEYTSDAYGVLFNKEMTGVIQVPKGISGAYTIPDTVTAIGDGAFSDCISLTSVTIPDSVTHVGYSAFEGCSNLTSVRIPDSVTFIDTGAFAHCSSLTSIEIPGSVTSLDSTFYECNKLASVTLHEGLQELRYSVFYNCKSLTEIQIPDSVVEISGEAFDSCTALTSVTIGKGVAQIESNAFGNCASLEHFYVDEANTSFSSDSFGVLYNKDKTKLIQCPSVYEGSFEVPDGVIEICPVAFAYCRSLSSVSIPSSVTDIASNAFSYTYGFALEGGNHYVRPADGAAAISEILVSEDNAAYSSENGVLYNRSKSELLQIPSGYSGQLILPESVKVISKYAGAFCHKLTGIVIPDTVTEIGEYAFYKCGLDTIALPSQLTNIKEGTFGRSSITEIVVPNSVVTIGVSAFDQCSNLQNVTISDSVTCIEYGVFWNCTNLKTVSIGAGVTSIGEYAFAQCSSLRSITIPYGVNKINSAVFSKCTNLTNITIPESVTKVFWAGFKGCDSLTNVYYGGTKEKWDAITIGYDNDPLLNATLHFADADVLVVDVAGNEYTSLVDAVNAATAGSKLTLMADIAEDVVIDKDIVLDLNGHSITGTIIVSDGCTLYGMDSQTDDYTVEDDFGYGKLTDVVGNVVGLPEESDAAQDGYLMITEDAGISFHRVNLQISSMSLRASAAGVYFKSDFAADEVVAAQVKSFGVALSIKSMPNANNLSSCQYSTFKNFTAGENKDATSTLLKGIMKETNPYLINKVNANTDVYGRAYIQLADGSYIFGAGVQRSLRQQVEAIDAMWASLSADQQASVVEMYRTYQSVMKSWEIPNIIAAA